MSLIRALGSFIGSYGVLIPKPIYTKVGTMYEFLTVIFGNRSTYTSRLRKTTSFISRGLLNAIFTRISKTVKQISLKSVSQLRSVQFT